MAAYKIQGSSTTDPRYANYQPNISIGTKASGGTLKVPATLFNKPKSGDVLGATAPKTTAPKAKAKAKASGSGSGSISKEANSVFDEQKALSDKIYNQNLSDALLGFDKSAAMAEDQIKSLETSKTQDQSILEQALRSVLTQADSTKSNLQNQAEAATEQGASASRQATVKSRNSLRGLGILSSSAAGELLSRPGTEFQKVSSDIQSQLSQGLKQVDDFVTSKTEENALKVQQLLSQYADLVGRIKTDLRFNKREQLSAVQQAQIARDQMLSSIRAEQTNYMLQAEASKNNLMSELGSLTTNTTNNLIGATTKVPNIQNTAIQTQAAGSPQVGLYQNKKMNFLDYGVQKPNQSLLFGYSGY